MIAGAGSVTVRVSARPALTFVETAGSFVRATRCLECAGFLPTGCKTAPVSPTLAFANTAVSAWSKLSGIVHVPVPLQAPRQPTNLAPLAAAGVSVTVLPGRR